jgi:hypothetical protein
LVETVITIVPRLPPAVDGVGDFSTVLAEQLHRDFGIQTQFVVADPNWSAVPGLSRWKTWQVSDRTAASLLQILQQVKQGLDERSKTPPLVTLLLHYVGHGYARRGTPVWLVQGLTRWRLASPNLRLVTMFHELYGSGPIWSSGFWTAPLQKQLTTRLTQLSDRCLTSRSGYADEICRLSQGRQTQVSVIPIFSNMGEPSEPPSLQQRQPRLIVFGSAGCRTRVYQRSLHLLLQTCRQLNLTEILDIGPALTIQLPPAIGDADFAVPIQSLGIQPADKVSQLLLDSRVGFFDYPVAFLEKSSIFAAYTSHRILPIGVPYPDQTLHLTPNSTKDKRDSTAELEDLLPYGLADTQVEGQKAQAIADRAYTWYQSHNQATHAQTFAKCLSDG